MDSLSRIEISRENLLFNIQQCRSNISKETQIVAVVKANAYGHGVKEVVSVTKDVVDYFQVDDLLELREIRQYTDKPVLVLGFVQKGDLRELVEMNAVLGVYDLETVNELNRVGSEVGRRIKIHVKIDARLGRQGILLKNTRDFFNELRMKDNLEVEAIYSHFSNIEDVNDTEHAKKQFEILMEAKEIAKRLGFINIFHHISATSGFLTDDNGWGGKIIRFGIGMYGLWPSENLKKRCGDIEFKPAMRWVTKVAQVKELPEDYPIGYGCTFVTKKPTTIAVIPQGYSDGYDRKFSNNSEVLIKGKRCSVLGRIAMNMFVVDVTGLDVKREDEVVLLGKQDKEEITADELADGIGTINYEVVTRVWPKLMRVVV